jgi:hypothetical protein
MNIHKTQLSKCKKNLFFEETFLKNLFFTFPQLINQSWGIHSIRWADKNWVFFVGHNSHFGMIQNLTRVKMKSQFSSRIFHFSPGA